MQSVVIANVWRSSIPPGLLRRFDHCNDKGHPLLSPLPQGRGKKAFLVANTRVDSCYRRNDKEKSKEVNSDYTMEQCSAIFLFVGAHP